MPLKTYARVLIALSAAVGLSGCYSIPDAQTPPVYSGDTPETYFDRTGFQIVWTGVDLKTLQTLHVTHPVAVKIERVKNIQFVAVEYRFRVQKQDKETIKEDFRSQWMKASHLVGADAELVTPNYLCEEHDGQALRGMCVDEARVVLPLDSVVKVDTSKN